MEVDKRTPLGVEAHQFLQSGRLDNVEARLPSKGAGFPVMRRANGISEQAFQGEGGPHLHHALAKYAAGMSFLQHDARVELQCIDVTVKLLQGIGHVGVIWWIANGSRLVLKELLLFLWCFKIDPMYEAID